MKGRPSNLCSGSYVRVQLGDAVTNPEEGPGVVTICAECKKYFFLRLSHSTLGRLAFQAHGWQDDVGVMPRHNGRAA